MQFPAGGRTTDPTTAPPRGMGCNPAGFFCGATRILLLYRLSHLADQLRIFALTLHSTARPVRGSPISIR